MRNSVCRFMQGIAKPSMATFYYLILCVILALFVWCDHFYFCPIFYDCTSIFASKVSMTVNLVDMISILRPKVHPISHCWSHNHFINLPSQVGISKQSFTSITKIQSIYYIFVYSRHSLQKIEHFNQYISINQSTIFLSITLFSSRD